MFMITGEGMGDDGPRFERGNAHDAAQRQSLLQSVGDVREVMFVLLDRARELGGRETTVVDALQLVANDLGMVESMLRVQVGAHAA
jgi:hypothetical protein